MNFASDNIAGASAPVLEAIVRAQRRCRCRPMAAIDITRPGSGRLFCDLFERDVRRLLRHHRHRGQRAALSAAVPPWGLVLCHREAHVIDDECGAPEFFMHGAKLVGLPGAGVKLDAARRRSLPVGACPEGRQADAAEGPVDLAGDANAAWSTASGEIGALGEVCRAIGLGFHMDGARFANALVALGCTPADMTWRRASTSCPSARPRTAASWPKPSWSSIRPSPRPGVSLQAGRPDDLQGPPHRGPVRGLLRGDHWLANARHANALARRLARWTGAAARVSGSPGRREANEVFPILPRRDGKRPARRRASPTIPGRMPASPPARRVAGGREPDPPRVSFATQEAQVDRLVEIAAVRGGRGTRRECTQHEKRPGGAGALPVRDQIRSGALRGLLRSALASIVWGRSCRWRSG